MVRASRRFHPWLNLPSSLLPAPMHPRVAKHCLDHSRHLVTASYNSSELQALNSQAIEKDVIFLGECGLDPGIDSMAAMRILERVKREGKQVKSFVSWCGGLPELSASKVPLRYKFSWSPKAVLAAAQNDASFKLGGKVRCRHHTARRESDTEGFIACENPRK